MPRKRIPALKQLINFERKTNTGFKAQNIAGGSLHSISPWTANFGRTLDYYEPIHETLLRYTERIRGKSLLHIASSSGIYTRFLQSRGVKAVAFDVGKDAIVISKKVGNKRIVQGDALPSSEKLPFADNSFHFFLSDNFLFSKYNAIFDTGEIGSLSVLHDLHRILKSNGIGIMLVGSIEKFNANLNYVKKSFNVLEIREVSNDRRVLDESAGIVVLRKKT
ncbi:MAG: methyltransferase domain-containing protein [Candidatus Diapherotrites archaeon]|nr:methyltransferase domain-containing protein [Candidatus Diapherotrites archaeon]